MRARKFSVTDTWALLSNYQRSALVPRRRVPWTSRSSRSNVQFRDTSTSAVSVPDIHRLGSMISMLHSLGISLSISFFDRESHKMSNCYCKTFHLFDQTVMAISVGQSVGSDQNLLHDFTFVLKYLKRKSKTFFTEKLNLIPSKDFLIIN